MNKTPLCSLLGLGLAMAIGCGGEVNVVAPVQLDVRACLMPVADKPSTDRVCGSGIQERFQEGLTACMAFQIDGADQPAIPFSLKDGQLAPQSSTAVDIDTGKPLKFRLYVLKPGQTADSCGGYLVSTPCTAGDVATPGGCLFAFKPEETRISGDKQLEIVLGTLEYPCLIECNDECALGDVDCRRICWTAQNPPQEACNGLDDDCDGETDEGLLVGEACEGRGSCGAGVNECKCEVDGDCGPGDLRWLQVVCSSDPEGSASQAVGEQCDSADNDCDGETDEDFLELGTDCDGPGECKTGRFVCADTRDRACCSTDPACRTGVPVGTELCNGRDDDCDGLTDEDYPIDEACGPTGECSAGVKECFCKITSGCPEALLDDPRWKRTVCSTEPDGSSYQGRPESCNARDDDCDGQTDEDWQELAPDGRRLGQACTAPGACGAGEWMCNQAEQGTCCSSDPACTGLPAGTELCNGIDDDCDGETDEDFLLETAEGTARVGAPCLAPGTCGWGAVECRSSDPDRRTVICDKAPGGSKNGAVAEICDGLDNDCDGEIDEDFRIGQPCPGIGGIDSPCIEGVWECRDRLPHCSTHPGGSDARAVEELCDGKDNDCDGLEDEVFRLGERCVEPGECGVGEYVCTADGQQQCSTLADSEPERCDGKDNDCDGSTDDGFEGLGQPCTVEGRCADGTVICDGRDELGLQTCCSADPDCSGIPEGVELCDGVDNNCDTQIDEGFELGQPCDAVGGAGSPCGPGVWECNPRNGDRICSTHPGGSRYLGVAETCDGKDNDCNGQVDDILILPPAAKTQGVCQGQTKRCVAGVLEEPNYQLVSGFEAVEASCDGKDNDCDGLVDLLDNNVTAPLADRQQGVCAGTRKVCAGAGGWQEPNYSQIQGYTAPEELAGGLPLCDGLDNDCDGTVDDGMQIGQACTLPGVCGAGTLRCTGDKRATECSSIARRVVEQCDGADNDCDGSLDEDWPTLGQDCGGGVGGCAGKLICNTAGILPEPVCCSSNASCRGAAAQELCNNVDDDCDGQTDEGLGKGDPCAGIGGQGSPCGAGVLECNPNTLATICSTHPGGSAYRGVAETCDGKDNDCDGTVDNNPTMGDAAKTAGVCVGMKKVCSNGAPVEPNYAQLIGATYEAVETKCDGLDNDCNGGVDDGLVIPLSSKQDGVCQGSKKECKGVNGWQDPDFTRLDRYEAREVTCDGRDNDCDGKLDQQDGDLVAPAALLTQGVCQGQKKVCQGANGWQEPDYLTSVPGSTYEATETRCDNLDNDCDGTADLADASVQAVQPPANKQSGVCQGQKKSCGGAAGWQEPNYAQTVGATYEASETKCDALDNDCDGLVDLAEDSVKAVQPLAAKQSGVCQGSKKECKGAQGWQEPEYVTLLAPNYEATETKCDNLDNDCDGNVDAADQDLLNAAPLADKRAGVCLNVTKVCSGSWQEPNYAAVIGGTYEATETKCDNLDNDCNGNVDLANNDAVMKVEQDRRPASKQLGVCQNSKQTCAGAGWTDPNYAAVIATYQATETLCDGLDNDCNGNVDLANNDGAMLAEQLKQPATKQNGVCQGAKKQCKGAEGWQEPDYLGYNAAYEASETKCDGLDNDCDTLVDAADPTVPPAGAPADKTAGVCAGQKKVCTTGSWVEPNYTLIGATYQAVETLCDNLDNDCDGGADLADPNIAKPNANNQQGVCAGVKKTCKGAGWVEPDSYATEVNSLFGKAVFQVDETFCDGLDNDCNGQTDEDHSAELALTCPAIPNSPCGVGPLECTCRAGHECAYPGDPGYPPNPAESDLLFTTCSTYPDGSGFTGLPQEECWSVRDNQDSDCDELINNDTHCRPDCDPTVVITTQADLDDCTVATFRRAGVAYQLNYNQAAGRTLLTSKNTDVPRWEYLPELAGGLTEDKKLALLIEGESTNLVKYSKNPWDGAGAAFLGTWTDEGADISEVIANDATSPSLDGKVTRVTVTKSTGYQSLWQPVGTNPFATKDLYSPSFWTKRPANNGLTKCNVYYQDDVQTYKTENITIGESWSRIIAPFPSDQTGQLKNKEMVMGLECDAENTGSDKYMDVYGFQLEKLPFASSFIANDNVQNIRAAETLELPANLLQAAQGSYLVWLKPEYTPTEVDGIGYPVMFTGSYLKYAFERDAANTHGKPTCYSGTRTAKVEITTTDWSRGQWIFLACVWDANAITAYYFDGELKLGSSAGGAMANANLVGAIQPAPRWAHSRDIRIYRTAQSAAQIQEFINQTKATYGR